ncbi:heavy metal-responsive transcriptional regulator [Candidatus Nucleicultrix amoebiphila]|uniref:HTH merR-type domain-containing protein n=1 Tax=Candidatus Nucleicultrix amoebiphila FS5 TaxID=1414854 RepID=A0A1W6N4P3_9PROT|nr:heavy metal-responsive transcriptional regulator [Candidatus Nucleicultrix amoebiphila]ARN84792.1 hypothetical protein GQ61_05240 [Candidatus Nucleicultrix amoebiphila FS5]
MRNYRISQLAKECQIKADTIRFYEKIGLMPKPFRGANGYRYYDKEALKRLRFIMRSKNIGFTLDEIMELLTIKGTSKNACHEIQTQAQTKIHLIDQKLQELQTIKQALITLVKQCQLNKKPMTDCPILDALETEEFTYES